MIRAARFGLAAIICCCWALAAAAQQRVNEPDALSPPVVVIDFANGPTTGAVPGKAGQRQTQGEVTGIKPMARVDNRFTNRVNNRVRNRIDRYYDPNSSTTTPFGTAADQIRSADPRRRR